eukprot:CAMPEP_0172778916 /NCGR_PEP_ID=MMETSP1074-20121228/202156_1 /TAXON_ID=2916 /ORGANISM="Ceratium fusus, Strain PA161109" /LENGTH=328 /DNA_ID=CAMNT_0013615869 /DNA_START=193 /DNA_END=1176 /DNA_ORIENTATION=+
MQKYHYNIRGLGQDPVAAETSGHDYPGKFQQITAPEMLETMLESRQGGRGFALRDAASLVARMRKLDMAFDETLVYMALFVLASLDMITASETELSSLSIPAVVKVIWAWQWLHLHDIDKDQALFLGHMAAPTHVMDEFGKLAMILMEAKFYRERHSRNPFKARTLSIAETVQLALEATEAMGMWQDHDCKAMKRYLMVQLALEATEAMGMWQDHDCKAMKRYLMNLDPENDGRVPLDIVYNQPETVNANGEQVFRFSESQDYLRSIGGLDETEPSQPQVLISNYVLGPANCYRSVTFHTFCCLNECDAVLTAVEHIVGGPSAKPDVI